MILALERLVNGALGEVWKYRRPNGRCPADEFLDGLKKSDRDKFDGQFDVVCQMGRTYYNFQRFKALTDNGKPLWEFKEFDHRLYCYRECTGDCVKIILLNGWTKQKKGRSKDEDAAISTAKRLWEECKN